MGQAFYGRDDVAVASGAGPVVTTHPVVVDAKVPGSSGPKLVGFKLSDCVTAVQDRCNGTAVNVNALGTITRIEVQAYEPTGKSKDPAKDLAKFIKGLKAKKCNDIAISGSGFVYDIEKQGDGNGVMTVYFTVSDGLGHSTASSCTVDVVKAPKPTKKPAPVPLALGCGVCIGTGCTPACPSAAQVCTK